MPKNIRLSQRLFFCTSPVPWFLALLVPFCSRWVPHDGDFQWDNLGGFTLSNGNVKQPVVRHSIIIVVGSWRDLFGMACYNPWNDATPIYNNQPGALGHCSLATSLKNSELSSPFRLLKLKWIVDEPYLFEEKLSPKKNITKELKGISFRFFSSNCRQNPTPTPTPPRLCA